MTEIHACGDWDALSGPGGGYYACAHLSAREFRQLVREQWCDDRVRCPQVRRGYLRLAGRTRLKLVVCPGPGPGVFPATWCWQLKLEEECQQPKPLRPLKPPTLRETCLRMR